MATVGDLEAARQVATNVYSLLIDGAVGGVAGGVQGIKHPELPDPVSGKPIPGLLDDAMGSAGDIQIGLKSKGIKTWDEISGMLRKEGVGLGTFVIPKSVSGDVIAQSGGDVSKLEEILGLNPGDLGTNPVRVDIPNPQNIRMPSGNEAGAWPGYWTPGVCKISWCYGSGY